MKQLFLFVGAMLATVILVLPCRGQIPRTISYQGVLTDTSGKVKPDGPYTLGFILYDSQNGDNVLWLASKSVTVKQGLFSAILGEAPDTFDPSLVKFDKQYWLAIRTIGSPEDLSPRIPLTSVAYSFNSIKSDTSRYSLNVPTSQVVVPIGTIIPWYDFGPSGPTFDTTYWVYCDGRVVHDVNSPLNGLTLPDLSDRYLVGYGTDGGGDIGTTSVAMAPVGNQNHTVNLQHSHSISGSLGSSVTGVSDQGHSHTQGSYAAEISWAVPGSVNDGRAYQHQVSMTTWYPTKGLFMGFSGSGPSDLTGGINYGTKVFGTSDFGSASINDPGHTHSIGTISAGNALSATQSIQPRSIRVRYVIRKR